MIEDYPGPQLELDLSPKLGKCSQRDDRPLNIN